MERLKIESTEPHGEIEIARAPDGTVNEIYHYTDESFDERANVYRYALAIIRVGGRVMTDEEIAKAVEDAEHAA